MPDIPLSLLQRIPNRPLPATLPQDRDVLFPRFAESMDAPPLYLLTYTPPPAGIHPSFRAPFTWSIPTHDLLQVFISLTFSLARPDHPDEVIIFLFYVWADNAENGRLHRDPRLHLADWSSFCHLLRDAFPDLVKTLPCVAMDRVGLFNTLIHQPHFNPADVRTVTRRFALLFDIAADTTLVPVDRPPPYPHHAHHDSTIALLRIGFPRVLAASCHTSSAFAATFNMVVHLLHLIGHPANTALSIHIPTILDHILIINDYLQRLSYGLERIEALYLDTAEVQAAPAPPAPVIDLTDSE